MERNQIIKSLIAEGFRLETLANMNDKQLKVLSETILSEQVTPSNVATVTTVAGKPTATVSSKNPNLKNVVTDLNKKGINVNVTEDDLKEEETECSECDKSEMKEEKPSTGLTKKQKSDVVKKAKEGKDIGKKGKGFEKVAEKATKQYGSKEKGEKVAAAAMWKNVQRENINEEKKPMTNKEIADEIRSFNNTSFKNFCGVKDGSKVFKFHATKFAADSIKKRFKNEGKVVNVNDDVYELHLKINSQKGEQKESLIGNQNKLDVNKNGKLDKEDFKKLKKQKMNEWVESVVKENYHAIATKGEITNLIKQKLNESNALKFNLPEDTEDCIYADGVSMKQSIAQKIANDNAMNKFNGRFPNKPYIKHVETAHRTDDGDFRYIVGIKLKSDDNEIIGDEKGELKEQGYAPAKPKPKTVPTTKPGEKIKPRTPYQPGPGVNPNPKAKLPEWMKFDNIKKD